MKNKNKTFWAETSIPLFFQLIMHTHVCFEFLKNGLFNLPNVLATTSSPSLQMHQICRGPNNEATSSDFVKSKIVFFFLKKIIINVIYTTTSVKRAFDARMHFSAINI